MSIAIAKKITGCKYGYTPESVELANNYLALYEKVFAEKGQAMPDTVEALRYLLNQYAEQIESDRVEIGKLRAKVNTLQQKVNSKRGMK